MLFVILTSKSAFSRNLFSPRGKAPVVFIRNAASGVPSKSCSQNLLQLQIAHKFFARVPRTHGLGRALLAALFRPKVVVFRHIDLGKVEVSLLSGCVAANGLCLLVLQ